MITTGIFTVHRYEIPYRYNETSYLLPFGDVHMGSPNCDMERFDAWCNWSSKKERAYFLGMGDYMDIASTSERTILTDKKLHESTAHQLEKLYKRQTEKLAHKLRFVKGRIIGLLEGNHFAQFASGMTTTQYLCELLECKYLGVSSFISLEFRPATKRLTTLAVDIWAHHGTSSGRLPGGTINSVGKMMEIAEADIYLSGHDHQKGAVNVSKLRLQRGGGGIRLAHRKVLLARTGAFLKGYEDNGLPSYVVDRALRPSDLGTVKIELTPRRVRGKGIDYSHVDIHTSI